MTIKQFSIKIHRFLGAILSLLFVIWFLSAFVIIYCHYPKYTPSERAKHSPVLSENTFPKDSTLLIIEEDFHANYPKEELQSIRLESSLRMGAYYKLQSSERTRYYDLERNEVNQLKYLDSTYFTQVAQLWNKDLVSIDTIQSLDQWTPFSRLRKDLPFYRLNLSGDDAHQVYISSRDGKIITEHTRAERIGAYFGAIPHWVYFTSIRQNVDLWIWIVMILSGLGVFMVLTGIYIGVDMMRLSRKKKKNPELSPYRKKTYRWHHIMGTFVGFFILAWIFSGFMSVVDIPDWLAGEEDLRGEQLYKRQALDLKPCATFDYSALSKEYPEGIRSLSWQNTLGHTSLSVLPVKGDEQLFLFDGDSLKPFSIEEEEFAALIEQAYKGSSYHIDKIYEYDGYYNFKPKQEGDFVWKAELETAGNPVVYVNNQNGRLRIFLHRLRVEQWLYQKPHNLRFVILERYPWLWTVVMWSLLLLGLFVSVTGLMMSVPYVKRSIKRLKRKWS